MTKKRKYTKSTDQERLLKLKARFERLQKGHSIRAALIESIANKLKSFDGSVSGIPSGDSVSEMGGSVSEVIEEPKIG